jgi:hypothetical protein
VSASEIRRYVLVDLGNCESEEFDDRATAQREASRLTALGAPHAVAVNIYVYDDHALLWTPNGDDVWPPDEKVAS